VQVGAGASFASSGAVSIAAARTVEAAGTLTLGGGGAASVVNAGTIETTGSGSLTFAGPLVNTAAIVTDGGTLTVEGAVTGAGHFDINGGTAIFQQAFSDTVDFAGASVLELSHAYSGKVTGLSAAGTNAIVLLDVAFEGVTTAAYSGSTTSGVLTVTEGASTAAIHLKGDYTPGSFVLSQAAGGGTEIIDPAAAGRSAAAAHAFIAAVAGFGASAAGPAGGGEDARRLQPATLVAPGLTRPAMA